MTLTGLSVGVSPAAMKWLRGVLLLSVGVSDPVVHSFDPKGLDSRPVTFTVLSLKALLIRWRLWFFTLRGTNDE